MESIAQDSATMNEAIHLGLRRDMRRLHRVLQAAPQTATQRSVLVEHLDFVLDVLIHHHTAEDEGLWPLLRTRADDTLLAAIDQAEAEHARLSLTLDRLRSALHAYGADGAWARDRLAEAVDEFGEVLDEHLEHEEIDVMPAAVDLLDEADWKRLNKEHFRPNMGVAKIGYLAAWLLDDLDDERAAVVRRQMPAPMQWYLQRRYAPLYERATRVAWSAPVVADEVSSG